LIGSVVCAVAADAATIVVRAAVAASDSSLNPSRLNVI
jgi:hypothetical protein